MNSSNILSFFHLNLTASDGSRSGSSCCLHPQWWYICSHSGYLHCTWQILLIHSKYTQNTHTLSLYQLPYFAFYNHTIGKFPFKSYYYLYYYFYYHSWGLLLPSTRHTSSTSAVHPWWEEMTAASLNHCVRIIYNIIIITSKSYNCYS